jgi:hypothetical protein
MDPQNLIPVLDPNPLPGPYWLLKLLLLTTFVLHLVAMNFTMGGGVIAVFSWLRSKKDARYRRLFEDLSHKIPVFLPAAITLGVAPLLFLQVLYGRFFYTATILMAWPWFLVLVCLTLAYYGFYMASFRSGKGIAWAGRILGLSTLLIVVVGFIYNNAFTLSSSPGRWGPTYFSDPSGWNLNLGEVTLYPRFLHFFVAALALGGLLVCFLGLARWSQDRDYARFLVRTGGGTFVAATLVQVIVGPLFLISLPRPQMLLFMGDRLPATVLLLVGLLGAVGIILMMFLSFRQEDPRRGVIWTGSLAALVVAVMALIRDQLRESYLSGFVGPGTEAVEPQWSVLILFVLLFLGGVALWLYMLARYGLLGRISIWGLEVGSDHNISLTNKEM